jgi:hypothetical protein
MNSRREWRSNRPVRQQNFRKRPEVVAVRGHFGDTTPWQRTSMTRSQAAGQVSPHCIQQRRDSHAVADTAVLHRPIAQEIFQLFKMIQLIVLPTFKL